MSEEETGQQEVGMAYRFLWNDSTLFIEFLQPTQEGAWGVAYRLELSRDLARKFAQNIILHVNTRLKGGDKKEMSQPTPLPQ